ncbi:MAG TPA: type II toxin-antitoxin system RelE/ParE family toxin [Terriglobales bacterium]|nr:type II toxin-antitoxin system RelE/ParE family toxin [Terriglobales bacterium]
MQIVEFGTGNWTVYAVCSEPSTCAVIELIGELDAKRASAVLADLQRYVPSSMPHDWVKGDFSWKLRGSESILEFRWSTKGGGTPRVYWFFDANRIIVCSHGVNKKGKTDEADIRFAERTRNDYLEAKKFGQLNIVKYKDFVDPKDGELK